MNNFFHLESSSGFGAKIFGASG